MTDYPQQHHCTLEIPICGKLIEMDAIIRYHYSPPCTPHLQIQAMGAWK